MQASAVCDIDEKRANRTARKYHISRAFREYERLVELGDLDLVDILTPTSSHAQIALAALEAGRNVLVEKPMALDSGECEAMIRKAERKGLMLCVFHNSRFSRVVTETKAAIDSGGLRVRTVLLQMHVRPDLARMTPEWAKREDTGGILWEALVHPVYIALYLMGSVRSVFALGSKSVMPVHDNFNVLLEGSGGARGYVEYSLNQRESKFTLDVTTEEGQRFEGDFRTDSLHSKDREFRGYTWDTFRSLYDDILRPVGKWSRHSLNVLVRRMTPDQRTRLVLMREVASYLRGEGEVPVTGEEGLQTVGILEAVRRSIDKGRPVDIIPRISD